MKHTFRSLESWPYPPTINRRSPYTFKAKWSDTLRLLDRELGMLGGSEIVIAAGFRDRDLRLDGMPRSDARAPAHPGIILAFKAWRLPGNPLLEYGTDVCQRWEHNVRSIALGLESLRAVDRYGITRRSEQYAGFRQLTTGADGEASLARGRALIDEAGGVAEALHATHPDKGGDPIDFQSVMLARGSMGSHA